MNINLSTIPQLDLLERAILLGIKSREAEKVTFCNIKAYLTVNKVFLNPPVIEKILEKLATEAKVTVEYAEGLSKCSKNKLYSLASEGEKCLASRI